MVLKLPRDLLEFVMAQTNGRAMQTVIIEILRDKQTHTQNQGKINETTERVQSKT